MAADPVHESGRILIGKSHTYQYLNLSLANRHGLMSGATGTGKTITLQVLAEGFSRAGTAVFTADIKGDLAGIAMPGDSKPALVRRAHDVGIAYEPDDFPVVFWERKAILKSSQEPLSRCQWQGPAPSVTKNARRSSKRDAFAANTIRLFCAKFWEDARNNWPFTKRSYQVSAPGSLPGVATWPAPNSRYLKPPADRPTPDLHPLADRRTA